MLMCSQEDFEAVAQALVQMGATRSAVNITAFADDLRNVAKQISNFDPVDPMLIAGGGGEGQKEVMHLAVQISRVARAHGLCLPREVGLVLKQALYFDRFQRILGGPSNEFSPFFATPRSAYTRGDEL